MALRRNEPSYRQLDQLVMEGRAQLVATSVGTTPSSTILVQPPAGQVAIINKVICTCTGARDSSPDTGIASQLLLHDASGTITFDGITAIAFQRTDAVFASPSGPDHRSSQPSMPFVWDLEMPIVVPPQFSLRTAAGSDMAGANFMLYGYMTDIDTARHLGYSPSTFGYTSGEGFTNRQGVRGLENTVLGSVIAGEAGYCIQLVDVNIRQQQLAHSPTNTSVLFHGVNIADTNTIFTACSNNPGDPAEWKFSPGIYLPEGDSLFFVSIDGARSSLNVTFRKVPVADVPKNHWWTNSALPTPGTATVGTSSLFTTATKGLTLKYTGQDTIATPIAATLTKTIPGKGLQHIVEGYAISVQKDTTVLSDQLFFAITTGPGGGQVGITGSGLGTTNNLISPILAASSHDQMIALAVDGLNIPCTPETGFVLIDTLATGATATPAAADLDVASSSFLVWGRTEQAKFGVDHFQGA